MRVNLLVLALFVLALGVLAPGAQADACNLTVVERTNTWVGLPSDVQACFDLIPFNTETRDNTIAIVSASLSLYSFADLISANQAPYNLSVR